MSLACVIANLAAAPALQKLSPELRAISSEKEVDVIVQFKPGARNISTSVLC